MMGFKNEVYLSGKVAGEVKQSGNGPHRFQIKQGGGEKKDKPGEYWPKEYFDVIVWPRQTELVEVVRKIADGQVIEINGRLKQESWQKDGVKHRSYSVQAAAITIPEKPLTPSYEDRVAPARSAAETTLEITDDDIPF